MDTFAICSCNGKSSNPTYSLNSKEMVDYLIKRGADTSITDKTGKNAQQIADHMNRNIDIKN
jgi:ankyrin repeat protein